MQTSPECLPCFLRQSRQVTGLAGCGPAREAEILQDSAQLIHSFDLALSPPENAVALYRLIARLTGSNDPFADLKQTANRSALAMMPRLREIIAKSVDPLLTSARLAIAGNIIDYGAMQEFDLEASINTSLKHPPAIDHFSWFQERLDRAKRILYLADNCGELVFDRLFIEQLGKPVTLAVKAIPIINDALFTDADECGLTAICRVVSNGTGCPGTPLDACSPEFQRLFRESDLIISKGQGNFETLSETVAPLFFMLLVKCQVVATHAAEKTTRQPGTVRIGDLLMLAPEAVTNWSPPAP